MSKKIITRHGTIDEKGHFRFSLKDNPESAITPLSEYPEHLRPKKRPTPAKVEAAPVADAPEDNSESEDNISRDSGKKRGRPKKLTSSKKTTPKASKLALDALRDFELCKCGGTPYLINRNQAIEIGSTQHKDHVARIVYTKFELALSDNNIREIAGVQRGEALYCGTERKVFNRVAAINETAVYFDLNDGANTIIEILPGKCRIAQNPDVLFYRPPHSKPLPMPDLPGNIDLLKKILSPIGEDEFTLIRSTLCFYGYGRPGERGTFPILNFGGPAGSLKSSKSKILKYIFDPGKPEGRTLTKDLRDLYIYAKNQYALLFDNVSHIDPDHQDAICSLSSQGGFGRKKNYTDDDETIFEECRPIITNGIEYRARPDLQDRKIDIDCAPIREEDRRTERRVWDDVERARPAVLGGILTAISKAMLIIEKHPVDESKINLPRLADFGLFSIALERGNGWTEHGTLDALETNYNQALSGMAEENDLYAEIKKLITKHNGEFAGTASELLAALEAEVDEKIAKKKSWPGNASKLGRWIVRNVSVLNAKKIDVDRGKSTSGDRIIRLTEIAEMPEIPF